MLEITDKVELSACILSLRNDGIFHMEMKEIERDVTLDDVKEMTETLRRIGNGKVYPVLVTLKRYNPITKEASEYAASEEAGKYTSADAIVIQNFAMRIASNFYIKIFKPIRPTKMFSSEDKAIEWLKTLR